MDAGAAGSEGRRDDFLVFGQPSIGEEEIAEVVATLRSGWIGKGPRVEKFEQLMVQYTGAGNAVATNSCTAALHLSLLALGIGPGDEVITTPMTFVATANAIVHTGARPVFADVSRDSMLISPDSIERAITPRTRAILPVHLAGRPCDLDAINGIAARHGIAVIEDAAHAIESRYRGRAIGSIGDLTCFSFYATKNVTTSEGGMVTTNDPGLAKRIRTLSLHGMSADAYQRFGNSGYRHYEVEEPGYKYNMTDVQAAIGIHQLQRVECSLLRRNEIWEKYQRSFSELPVELPQQDDPQCRHARHLYTIMVDPARCGRTRDEVLLALKEENIGCGVHYTALHLHSWYRKTFGFKEGDFPNAEWIGARTLSLPLSAKLSEYDVESVASALRRVLS